MPQRKRKPIRRIQPYERLPMHHAEVVGGDAEAAILETPGGDFKIQTREYEYELDPPPEEPDVHIEAENVFVIKKAQIQPEDIKRLSNLEEAGIRGGIHSKRTYLMALHDGSLWVWKQTGVEERDEIFVYELAKRMFRSIVPEVQPVFVPKLGWGSAMRKVAGVPAGRVDGLHGYFHGNDEMMADLTAMLVLDYMTGNPDRHSNNWFIMHNDRLAAIDNGWAGEDLTMSFADVFQPARLAGMMEDERLWPQLLKGIAALIQDLEGRGDEVRALAEEIGIDKTEAVEMVRLWEVKLQKLTRLVEAEAGRVEKARIYVEGPGEVPPDAQMETGPRGGTYYESEPVLPGMERPSEVEVRPMQADEALESNVYDDQKDVFDLALERFAEETGLAANSVNAETRVGMKIRISEHIAGRTGFSKEVVSKYLEAWSVSASDHNDKSIDMQRAAVDLFGVEPSSFIEEAAERMGLPVAIGGYRASETARAIVQAMYDETQEFFKAHGVRKLVLFRGMRWLSAEAPGEIFDVQAQDTLVPGVYGGDLEFHLNPLSSWAFRPDEALAFANYKPEGVDYEPDFEDPAFQERAHEALQEACAEAGGKDCDDEEVLEEWAVKFLEDAGYPNVESWAYRELDIEPPKSVSSTTRAFQVVEIPAEKVVATAMTGLGCLEENEVVIMGGADFHYRVYLMEGADEYGEEARFPHYNDLVEWEKEKRQRESPEGRAQLAREQAWQTWANENLSDLAQQRMDAVNEANAGTRRALDEEYLQRIKAALSEEEADRLRQELWNKIKENEQRAEEPFRIKASQMIEEAGFEVPEGWKPRGYESIGRGEAKVLKKARVYLKPGQEPPGRGIL